MTNRIKLNQVGFMPKARKTAVYTYKDNVFGQNNDVTNMAEVEFFTITDSEGKEVYRGKLTGPVEASYAGETVYQADFSDFSEQGTYSISISDSVSYPFVIGDKVYDSLLKDLLRMLTKQRCGVELTEKYAGKAAHPACHNTPARIYGTEEFLDVNGGWHDAGDYGRYIVAAATAVEDLLLTYEDFKDLWSNDDLNIPESGNGIPDILDEAKFELDWMLKMQDEKTGGVYHKVTCHSFPDFVMPQEETEELVLSPVSNAATAAFAAIMAKASDVYRQWDEAFCEKALSKAKKAYAYLTEHMEAAPFRNPKDIVTGEYSDKSFTDEMFWAAVELYKVTGDKEYRDFAEKTVANEITHGYGWDDVGSYGNMAYLSLTADLIDNDLAKKIIDAIIEEAKSYLENSKSDGYMSALGDNYCWGSNLPACSYARMMLAAADYTGNEEYRKAAYDQMSYILGQNATGYSFVTGYGTKAASHPHHRPSIATGETVDGMVVGGPDGGLHDPCAVANLKGLPPARCYVDNYESYSTNEITIYWNSPFIYLLSAMIDCNK